MNQQEFPQLLDGFDLLGRLEQLTKDLVEQLKENIASEKEDFRMMEIEDPDAFADFKEHLHHGSKVCSL